MNRNQGQRPASRALLEGHDSLPLVNDDHCAAMIPHPHGVIGDRRLSVVQETTDGTYYHQPSSDYVYRRTSVLKQTMDSNVDKQASSLPAQTYRSLPLTRLSLAPVRQPKVAPREPTRVDVAGHHAVVSRRSTASQNDTNTLIPSVFEPMSNLFATGSQYVPEPFETGSAPPNHHHLQDLVLPPSTPLPMPMPMTLPRRNLLLANPGGLGHLTDIDKLAAGFSPRYMGDIHLRNNQSEDIPDDQNCSLFLVNLPARLTVHGLLAAIHKLGPTGRIYAVHINGPEPARGHPGCAAKVVFFRRDVAHDFYARCAARWPSPAAGSGESSSGGGAGHPGLLVGDGKPSGGGNPVVARVMWNRIRTSERPHLAQSNASRVLLVAGPREFVSPRALAAFFASKLQFQTDRVIVHVEGSDDGEQDAVVEYRFGSFRCQAQAARLALQRERPQVRCFFGADPLEPCAWKPLEYFNFEREG